MPGLRGDSADRKFGTSSRLRILGEETTKTRKDGGIGVVVSPSAVVSPGAATFSHSGYQPETFSHHRESCGQATTRADDVDGLGGAAMLLVDPAASGGDEGRGEGGLELTAVDGVSAVDSQVAVGAAGLNPCGGGNGAGVTSLILNHLNFTTEIEPTSSTSRFASGVGDPLGGVGGGPAGGTSGQAIVGGATILTLTPRSTSSLQGSTMATAAGSLVATRVRWIRKVLLLAVIFSASFSMVVALLLNLPGVESLYEEEGNGIGRGVAGEAVKVADLNLVLKFPSDMNELKAVRATLARYQDKYRVRVEVGLVCLYVFCQTFMIPGTIFLNILAGSLYGFWKALILVTLSASVGASCCYCLSHCLLKDIVVQWFPDKCEYLSREVQRHRNNLINYILFLRITPILPNWFINMAAPLVSVPFKDFYLGTFFGLVPGGFIAVKAGRIIATLNSVSDLYDFQTVLALSTLAVLSLLPVFLKKKSVRQSTRSSTKHV